MKQIQLKKEAGEQEAVFDWAEIISTKYPDIEMLYHIPNGGSRNKVEAANLKRQGVKAGVPDLCLPVPRGKYHGLYIEMKAGKNKTSKKQKEWIEKLRAQGYVALSSTGFEQTVGIILKYLELEKDVK